MPQMLRAGAAEQKHNPTKRHKKADKEAQTAKNQWVYDGSHLFPGLEVWRSVESEHKPTDNVTYTGIS